MIRAENAVITENDKIKFEEAGFLVIENLLELEAVSELRGAFPRVFAGQFETGVYPDEWYWREGMSLPDVTRHMANAWKSDLGIARLVLNERIARIACALTGWNGVRLGQDTLWWKTPGTKAVALHQDTSFMDFMIPAQTLTCWVALDDTSRDAGTLEYIPGSHKWPLVPIPEEFHKPEDYRATMRHMAETLGEEITEIYYAEIPAGSCIFHAGEIWHGSGPNVSRKKMRRSIGIHLLPEEARFSERGGGYIYRRYQKTGDPVPDESFFPVLWSGSGSRTGWIDRYCKEGHRL
ncbi:MAG: phytanoyl-CoA dioxygenase family protein [Sneathiellales bacterium]|nr:phytanoyl-CoA dioxygenase family protein [Sneathiellales bacterium]